MFKKIMSITIFLIVLYFIISIGWSVLNMQSCSVVSENRKEWPCEQIAKDNSENCHYIIMRWKKVDYERERKQCQSWQSKNK
ncbi:MAG: hypothetical protein A2420_00825 [Candidatus Moranbacteria bacterium RIFOXYC1_FULL_44_13]|nr:MAG: hypothetical protein A2184_03950 [Candidatus Moranbacteria bacterium RIFOXYA1_FULL_44_7]OGI32684.1 MAG: hypothetical protein A2420_00825 [Candidatus Moranbacteria bacterium RIFOXYC1_FULL_44_13]OGI37107.1 MAG: hypothetical protein A2612_04745 [Candidatus Moranbacteria bacterium RIFOXYD1_FULL_44_12]